MNKTDDSPASKILMQISLRNFMLLAFAAALLICAAGLWYRNSRSTLAAPYVMFDTSLGKESLLGGYYMKNQSGTIDVAILRLPRDYPELVRLKAPLNLTMLAITNDKVLEQIDFRDFPKLRRVALTELSLTKEIIAELSVLPELEYVCITAFQKDPTAALPALNQLSGLRHLILRSHHLASFDQLPVIETLETFELESHYIDDQCLATLQEHMPRCHIDFRPSYSGGQGTDRETLSVHWPH
ncbi:MAG: hypothetical protein WBD20_12740 [Pirellulaceae bacterium]